MLNELMVETFGADEEMMYVTGFCFFQRQGQAVKSERQLMTPATIPAAQSRIGEQVASVCDVDGGKGPRGTSCPLKNL